MNEIKGSKQTSQKISWEDKVAEMSDILNILKNKNEKFAQADLLEPLEVIFGPLRKIQGADQRILFFLEFCFKVAQGPYSEDFPPIIPVLKRIFYLNPALKHLIERSADGALSNMVLNARGRLKFRISDQYELFRVLEAWQDMGLEPLTPRSVLSAIFKKRLFKVKIKQNDVYLLARLRQVFPHQQNRFLGKQFDLDQAIHDLQKERFATIIENYKEKGYNMEKMIEEENHRKMPVGVKRNNLLAFLVKSKQAFKCQVCTRLQAHQRRVHVQAHHMVPLAQGGADERDNLIILCMKHHQEAHAGILIITPARKIKVKYKEKNFTFPCN